MRKFTVLTLFLAAFLASLRSAEKPGAPVTIDDFFAEADSRGMQLSPDGHSLAFLTTLGLGKVGIALMHLDSGQVEALVSAKDENIKTFFWKGNDYIIYGGDLKGAEQYAWRSIAVAAPTEGEKRKAVPLSEAFEKSYASKANFISSLVSELRGDPERILAYGRKEIGQMEMCYFTVNVRNGFRQAIDTDENSFTDTGGVADNLGHLRIRETLYEQEKIFEVRRQPGQRYVEFARFPAKSENWTFLAFGADNETAYLIDKANSDTGALRAYNVRTGEMSPPLFSSPDGEIDSLLLSPDHSRLDGVLYTTDKPHYHFFNPSRAKLQEQIDKTLPKTLNHVVSTSWDEKVLLINAHSDRDPGTYLLFDRTKGQMRVISKVMHQIKSEQMRPMEPITYAARDGLVIHGYLTRPANSEGKKVPLILNPHGGPYGPRDHWGFNPEVQYLASLGFAVLQVNYRGSGGYGTRFLHAGFHEWGGKMQDDLTDAVHWAIDQGIADPKRVVIYGASYGGYATLAGLVYTPELFCCGINYVGVTDLADQAAKLRTSASTGSNLFARESIGDDITVLKERSPVNYIDRLRVPLMNAYGYHDPRVDIEQWWELERRLKAAHKDYEITIEDNEGHGFRNEANRKAFYEKMAVFLKKHVPMD